MPDEDIIITRRKTPPYWLPDANVVLQMFLAVSVVVMVGYILYQLLDGKVSLEQAQRDLLMVLFGIVLGCFKDVFGFAFGSSAGQKKQGEVITKSLENKDKILADNATATATIATAAATTAASSSSPSADALKAAAVVAPAAAAVAAPPAAEVAAPPAAREAVAEALAEQAEQQSQKPKE